MNLGVCDSKFKENFPILKIALLSVFQLLCYTVFVWLNVYIVLLYHAL